MSLKESIHIPTPHLTPHPHRQPTATTYRLTNATMGLQILIRQHRLVLAYSLMRTHTRILQQTQPTIRTTTMITRTRTNLNITSISEKITIRRM
jgi:hypothetical protein